MSKITRESLQEARKALQAGVAELKELQQLVLTGPSEVINRYEIALKEIEGLKKEFERQLKGHKVDLGDGRSLQYDQYEAFQKFAASSKVQFKDLIARITIKRGVVVELDLSRCGLRTLEGLQEIGSIKRLTLVRNRGITSLQGIPTQSLEELDASKCGLIRDLSGLEGASKLRELSVVDNNRLTSLKGVPTEQIKFINASFCRLKGDHNFLAAARNLRRLDISGNYNTLTLDLTKFVGNVEVCLD